MPPVTKKKLQAWEIADPVTFITTFLKHPDGSPVLPHEAQIAIIRAFTSDPEFIDLVIEAGRQLGKSTGLAWLICWYIIYFHARHVYIVAPSLDQARIIYEEVVWQFENTPLRTLLKRKPVDFPFPHLELKNGSHVHGRGSNSPKYLRGKLVHLLIADEAAYFKDGVHSSTIEPMFTVTSTMPYTGIIRISTPFGEGDFDDGVQAAKADTSRLRYLHFTSYDNPFANRALLDAIKARYGEDSLLWRTEYMAESVGSDLAVFPTQDIKWAYENYPYVTERGAIQYPIQPLSEHTYVQGVDLANQRDYFVATLLDTTNPTLAVQVRHDRQRKRGYAAYKATIRENYSRYARARTLVDATSLGESVVEDLGDIGAEGFKFSSNTAKYDLVHGLVRALNEHRLALPYVPELIAELKNFQYEMTAGKVLKMEARTGHDDYVMSLALAEKLASSPVFTGFFMGGVATTEMAPPSPLGGPLHPLDTSKKAEKVDKTDPYADLNAS